jgi:hypothetical protein
MALNSDHELNSPSRHKRLPSLPAIGKLFFVCVIVVQLWEFYNLFREIPALRYHETTWDLIGILAVVQVFALFESLVVLLVLTGLAAILPTCWLRDQFVAKSTLTLLVSAAWAIWIHLAGQPMTTWPVPRLWLTFVLFMLSIVGVWLLVDRMPRIGEAVDKIVNGVVILGQVYVAITLLGLAIIFIRNI